MEWNILHQDRLAGFILGGYGTDDDIFTDPDMPGLIDGKDDLNDDEPSQYIYNFYRKKADEKDEKQKREPITNEKKKKKEEKYHNQIKNKMHQNHNQKHNQMDNQIHQIHNQMGLFITIVKK